MRPVFKRTFVKKTTTIGRVYELMLRRSRFLQVYGEWIVAVTERCEKIPRHWAAVDLEVGDTGAAHECTKLSLASRFHLALRFCRFVSVSLLSPFNIAFVPSPQYDIT